MAKNSLFQTTFLQFHDKPYYSQVLHLRDGQLGITLLSCRACAVTEETRDLLPPRPRYHDTDGKQVSCYQCHFLPCLALSGVTFSACCHCDILSNCMLKFSS